MGLIHTPGGWACCGVFGTREPGKGKNMQMLVLDASRSQTGSAKACFALSSGQSRCTTTGASHSKSWHTGLSRPALYLYSAKTFWWIAFFFAGFALPVARHVDTARLGWHTMPVTLVHVCTCPFLAPTAAITAESEDPFAAPASGPAASCDHVGATRCR